MQQVHLYRKRSVEVEAIQLSEQVVVATLEGDVVGHIGDWLITGIKGERYPCSSDVFEKNYEQVSENRYRKRPVVVTAIPLVHRITIETPDGDLVGQPGDKLIFDENSMSTYPIKLDVFLQTYEQVA